MNEITILGAYGTKAKGFGTSSFYLNEKNVVDAGNLLKTLKEKSSLVENIWLSHSHLDHISDIAYILDNYFVERKKSLNIIGLPQTINAVKKHFLNDLIWPDFSKINMFNSDEMSVTYTPLELGERYSIGENEYIEAIKTDHTVPSCGYIYTKDEISILITSDTYALDNIIEKLNSRLDIKAMVVECSFPSSMELLAKASKHLTPKLLFDKLESLTRKDVKIYINHIKPLHLETMVEEIL